MSFHNIRFPEEIGFGATKTVERRTEVVELASGREERRGVWARSKRRYNITTGIRKTVELADIEEFFEAREGALHGFCFKDWSDYRSSSFESEISAHDQCIGTGDGQEIRFRLVKFVGGKARIIRLPVQSSVRIAIDDLILVEGRDFDVEALNGWVNFHEPPSNGAPITAGFEFDVPVRFGLDHLTMTLSNFDAGEFTDIPLVEIAGDLHE